MTAAQLWKRLAVTAALGVALGLAFGVFLDQLPEPWGTVALLVVVAAIMWWAGRRYLWARRMSRELGEVLRRLEDEP